MKLQRHATVPKIETKREREAERGGERRKIHGSSLANCEAVKGVKFDLLWQEARWIFSCRVGC